LSTIPYTGLDLGVAGSIIYWFALIGWAAFAAYVVVGYRGGVVGAVYNLTHAFNGPTRVTPDAVIVHETITAPAAVSYDTSNEDVVAAAVKGNRTTDTMTLENDGDAPRIVIRRA
jgi:hypothetical protein